MAKTLKEYNTARSLLADKTHWCKNDLGVKRAGNHFISCNPRYPDCQRVCLLGALERIYGPNVYGPSGYEYEDARQKLQEAVDKYTGVADSSIASFNDRKSTTHKDIVKVLKLAKV